MKNLFRIAAGSCPGVIRIPAVSQNSDNGGLKNIEEIAYRTKAFNNKRKFDFNQLINKNNI